VQTKAGSPKVPHYSVVPQWVLDWIATKDPKEIKKAFRLCGLVVGSSFDKTSLHPPLRELISSSIDMHERHLRYLHLVGDDEEDEREPICLQPPAWYLPEDTHSSLFCCLRHSLASSIADYAHVLTSYMRELDDLKGLFDDNYITSLRNGERDGSELEIFAAAQLHSCNIQVKTPSGLFILIERLGGWCAVRR
ncbi:hypothetical protein PHYSODRAFT_524083, partial [Phytophthora sojae]